MKNALNWPRVLALSILLVASVVAIGFVLKNRASVRPAEYRVIDMSALEPGTETSIRVGASAAIISVPEGKGFSFGAMNIEISDSEFTSLSIERDGSPESAWIADVNGDGIEDAVFVIRSAGSGSYTSVFVLESAGKSFRVRDVPDIRSVSEYMGHEEIVVKDGKIRCRFPTYVDHEFPRIDMQWKPKDAVSGELPVRSEPDSNANPSGATRTLQYDYSAHNWKAG